MPFAFPALATLAAIVAVDWGAVANALICAAIVVLLGIYLIAWSYRGRNSRVGQSITKAGIVFSLLTVAVAVVALQSKINFLVLVFGMLLSAFVLSFILSRLTMRGLDFARRLPEAVHATEPFQVELRVTNLKRRLATYGLVVHDEPPAGLAAERTGGVILELGPRQTASLHYGASAARRGVFHFRAVSFSTRFPFGLFHQGRRRDMTAELVVYPRLGEVAAEFLGRTRALALSHQRARGAQGEEEFRNLREYRHGDNPRRIHWKSSAKLGKPLVRELEAVVSQRVLVILDTRCPSSGEETLEVAISFAATLARELMSRGFFVGLAAYTPDLFVAAPTKAQDGLRALYEALARLEPNPRRRLAELVGEPAVRAQGRVVTIVTLCRRDADAEEALGLLSQRQLAVVPVDVGAPSFAQVFWFRHDGAPGSECSLGGTLVDSRAPRRV